MKNLARRERDGCSLQGAKSGYTWSCMTDTAPASAAPRPADRKAAASRPALLPPLGLLAVAIWDDSTFPRRAGRGRSCSPSGRGPLYLGRAVNHKVGEHARPPAVTVLVRPLSVLGGRWSSRRPGAQEFRAIVVWYVENRKEGITEPDWIRQAAAERSPSARELA